MWRAGGGPAPGGRVRRSGAGARDRRRARTRRGRLAQQHGVPRRLPRRAPCHHLVLAGYRQVLIPLYYSEITHTMGLATVKVTIATTKHN